MEGAFPIFSERIKPWVSSPGAYAAINPFNQPCSRLLCSCEHDIVLEDVIQINKPTAATIENGDRPAVVGS